MSAMKQIAEERQVSPPLDIDLSLGSLACAERMRLGQGL